MEIENLLGWEHILQINNQLIKHNHYFDLITTQIVILSPPPPFEILLCVGLNTTQIVNILSPPFLKCYRALV